MDVEQLTSVLYQQETTSKNPSASVNQNVDFLPKITEGRVLSSIMCDADDFGYEHDELQTPEEANLIAAFIGEMGDSDVITESGAGSVVDFAFKCTEWLRDLEKSGFWVFGKKIRKRVRIAGHETNWQTAVLKVVRKSNPQISNAGKTNPQIAKVTPI